MEAVPDLLKMTSPLSTSKPDESRLVEFHEQLLGETRKLPAAFANTILRHLCKLLPIKAASFYYLGANADLLVLGAQIGLSYKDYASFELPMDTLPGEAMQKGDVRVFKDLPNNPKYRDRALLNKFSLTCLLVVPFNAADVLIGSGSPSTACLCLYPSSDDEAPWLAEYVNLLRPFLSQAYQTSIDCRMLALRAELTKRAYASTDLNSCLHRTLQLLKHTLGFEAGSIFLHDDKVQLLRLHATTGIDDPSNRHKRDIYYGAADGGNLTWKVYLSGKVISNSNLVPGNGLPKFKEKVRDRLRSFLGVPILHPLASNEARTRPRGVLRLVNRQLVHDDNTEVIDFSWVDRVLLTFASDLVALKTHMFQSNESRVDYFEQIMHGTGSAIAACLQNIDILERHTNLVSQLPSALRYTISDTQDFLLDVKSQMDRLSVLGSNDLEVKSIHVSGEILSKSVSLFERMASSVGISRRKITNLHQGGFYRLPKVMADPKALLTVFRNLIENSIKYHDIESGQCNVSFEYELSSSHVIIIVCDDGIGIPKEASKLIFEGGFRAENALRQNPAGTGLGLAQSLEIMRSMGGDITLESHRPATFKVHICREK
jgi:signal transduction histidine kinase